MLAYVRGCLRGAEGEEFRIPTTALDEVLDERGGSVERSLWDPRLLLAVQHPEAWWSRCSSPWVGDGGAGVVRSVKPGGDRARGGRVGGSQVRQHGEQGDCGDCDARGAGNDAQ